MKKISFLLLFAVSFSVALAQNTASKRFGWGAKLGLNASNIRVEDAENTSWKAGLVTGLFFQVKVNEQFSLQPELLYSSMGGRNSDGNESSSLRLNYFSVPLLAKYKISKKFAVVAGPQADVLIQAKVKDANNKFTKITDSFKESSFNATAGAEVWPLHCVGFTLRYIYGFRNLMEDEAVKMKNQGVQLTASLRF